MGRRHTTLRFTIALVALGMLMISAAPAWADGDGDDAPVRVKKKLKLRKQPAPENPATTARRDPTDTAHRWMLKELSKHMAAMADAEGEAAKSPMHYWFETKDVPLAGLRDAFKADGWTADELMAWVQRHFMHVITQHLGSGQGMFGIGRMLHGMPRGGPRARFRRGGNSQGPSVFPWGQGARAGRGPMQGRTVIIWDGERWRTWGGDAGMVGNVAEWTSDWFGGGRKLRQNPEDASDIQQLIELLRQLEGGGGRAQGPPPAPPGAPRPPVPPKPLGAHDMTSLHEALEQLRRMRDDNGGVRGDELRRMLDQIQRLLQPDAAPERPAGEVKRAKKAEKKPEVVKDAAK